MQTNLVCIWADIVLFQIDLVSILNRCNLDAGRSSVYLDGYSVDLDRSSVYFGSI